MISSAQGGGGDGLSSWMEKAFAGEDICGGRFRV